MHRTRIHRYSSGHADHSSRMNVCPGTMTRAAKSELPQEGLELTLADAVLADSSHEWRTDLGQLVLW